jgi:hypothetical protein
MSARGIEGLSVRAPKETPMLTPESRRQHFPSLERMTYLNTAVERIPPLAVHEGLRKAG